jgi:hypothetical protein
MTKSTTPSAITNTRQPAAAKLEPCDYLVMVASAALIAFIDTLLTKLPSAKIVIIDKKAMPG